MPSAASFQPELLIALAISPAVASAFGAAGVFTLPSVLVNDVVLTANEPSAFFLMVVPSVLTDRSYTLAPFAFCVVVTVTEPSADFTSSFEAAMLVLMLFTA